VRGFRAGETKRLCAPGSRPEPPSSATAANGFAASPSSRVSSTSAMSPAPVAPRPATLPSAGRTRVLANVKNSLLATHRVVGAKHLPRYRGAFAWRFNRRFALKTIDERLAIAATTTRRCPTAS